MKSLKSSRLEYTPQLPSPLKALRRVSISEGAPTSAVDHASEVKELFPQTFGRPKVKFGLGEERECAPLRVGVVLSGGQAPGGHNVISGLFDALAQLNCDSKLIGFVDGPGGIVDNKTIEITSDLIDQYRNLGGFDIIGSGRTKIESEAQIAASIETVKALELDGLVVIGGDDSNTNAAILAEHFLTHGCTTKVIGVPKTIDGDLKSDEIEISFGHDTACKVYNELIGNLMRDAMSARKYYHFVKLMGRSASHIALECALATHPNVTLIGEEVAAGKWTLAEVTDQIVECVVKRAAAGKNYGVVLIPEGLIEFIPEVGQLIGELNDLLASHEVDEAIKGLSGPSKACFDSLPRSIAEQLLLDRDPHGNVQVSRIATETLLIESVTRALNQRSDFQGKFNALGHFFGYEGRSAMPSNFDADYCYALGKVAAVLISHGLTGYMSSTTRLIDQPSNWEIGGIPITMMMNMERRGGKLKPVIQKALVDLKSAPFAELQRHRATWAAEDDYQYPGPIQFSGDHEITDTKPHTLMLEQRSNMK